VRWRTRDQRLQYRVNITRGQSTPEGHLETILLFCMELNGPHHAYGLSRRDAARVHLFTEFVNATRVTVWDGVPTQAANSGNGSAVATAYHAYSHVKISRDYFEQH